jgi:hypothetical protein
VLAYSTVGLAIAVYAADFRPEVKNASTKKDQARIPTDNHCSRPSETGINFQLIQHRQIQSKDSK